MNFNKYIKAFNRCPPPILQGHSPLYVLQELSNNIAYLSNVREGNARHCFEILFANSLMTAGCFNWMRGGVEYVSSPHSETVSINEICAVFNLALAFATNAVVTKEGNLSEDFALFINTLYRYASCFCGDASNIKLEVVLERHLRHLKEQSTTRR